MELGAFSISLAVKDIKQDLRKMGLDTADAPVECGFCVSKPAHPPTRPAFSSNCVSPIKASQAFYEKLGFKPFFGDASQGWLIMKNGAHAIGLFQGMFETNIMTFNPGWDANAQPVDDFTDVRAIQKILKTAGVTFVSEADGTSTGPASFMVLDPDGNTILVDQHI